MKAVIAYTDGACRGNPGPGGWGVSLQYGQHRKELSGGEAPTTNNRMELMAAISALESLHERCAVTLHTDSKYVLQGLTEWLPGLEEARLENSRQEAGQEPGSLGTPRRSGRTPSGRLEVGQGARG